MILGDIKEIKFAIISDYLFLYVCERVREEAENKNYGIRRYL